MNQSSYWVNYKTSVRRVISGEVGAADGARLLEDGFREVTRDEWEAAEELLVSNRDTGWRRNLRMKRLRQPGQGWV